MFEQKLLIHIESCLHCYEHPAQSHIESTFHAKVQEIETQLTRTWKLVNILVNNRQLKPRIGSFEVSYNGMVLFSKLTHQVFPKPHEISTMLLALHSKTEYQRQIVKLKVKGSDLYSYVRKNSAYIRLSLKSAQITLNELISGKENREIHQRPQSTLCKTSRKVIKSKRNNCDTLRISQMRNSRGESLLHSKAEIERVKSQKNSKLLSKNSSLLDPNLGSKQFFKKRPSYVNFSSKKIKRYMFLKKENDSHVVESQYDSEDITLEELSSQDDEEPKEVEMTKAILLKRRAEEGFSTNLQSKEIGEGTTTRRYSFQFKTLQPDESDELIKSRVLKKKSQFANQNEFSQASSDTLTEFAEAEQTQSNHESQENEEIRLSNIIEVKESVNASLKELSNHKNEEPCNEQELEDDAETIIVTNELIGQNIFTLQLIQWFFSNNPDVFEKIAENSTQNFLTSFSTRSFALNLFNTNKGVFDQIPVKVRLSDEETETIFEDKTYITLAGMINMGNLNSPIIEPQKIIRTLTGSPLIKIPTLDLKKMKRIVYESYFKKDKNRIGKVYCFPNQSEHYIQEIIDFSVDIKDFTQSNLTLVDQNLDQSIWEFERFALSFEFVILLFYETEYFHQQLSGLCQCEESEFLNPTWKVLLEVEKECKTFLEFTEANGEQKPVNIAISLIEGGEFVKKEQIEQNERQWIVPKEDSLQMQKEGRKKIKFSFQKMRTSVVGQINRKGTFFFELCLQPGLYCCEVTRAFEKGELNYLHFYSSEGVFIQNHCLNYESVAEFVCGDQN